MKVDFYLISRRLEVVYGFDRALFGLAKTAIEKKIKSFIVTPDSNLDMFDARLWLIRQEDFLPHGQLNDNTLNVPNEYYENRQPLLLAGYKDFVEKETRDRITKDRKLGIFITPKSAGAEIIDILGEETPPKLEMIKIFCLGSLTNLGANSGSADYVTNNLGKELDIVEIKLRQLGFDQVNYYSLLDGGSSATGAKWQTVSRESPENQKKQRSSK